MKRLAAYLLRHLVDALLTREENGCRQDALDQLAADTLIQTLNALLLHDCEDTVKSGLVPLRMSLAGLQTALHNAVGS